MDLAIHILIAIIALFHIYVLWLEMFAWETRGKKVFRGFPRDLFTPTKAMAANQGLYNGFLAAGLIWTYFITNMAWQQNVSIFFLACVAIAGIFGGISADKKIFFVQGIPALVTLALILLR